MSKDTGSLGNSERRFTPLRDQVFRAENKSCASSNINHGPLAKNDLFSTNKKKKKEDESSNTLQSDGNQPTCSKKTDEVKTVNGKKIRYTLSVIIPLANLHGNVSKFLTKTCFWESIRARLSIDLTWFPNFVFWVFLNLRLRLKIQNKYSFVALEFT